MPWQVGYRTRTLRQLIQCLQNAGINHRRIQLEIRHDGMQISVLGVGQLMQQMYQLEVGVMTQFAECRGAVKRPVHDITQLTKKLYTAYVRHGFNLHNENIMARSDEITSELKTKM